VLTEDLALQLVSVIKEVTDKVAKMVNLENVRFLDHIR
jgi:hypothetical protein